MEADMAKDAVQEDKGIGIAADQAETCQVFGQGEYAKTYPKPKAVYIGVDFVDGRKGIKGLIAYTLLKLGKDPTSGDLYAYCGRDGRRIKMLYYCEGVYWLIQGWRQDGRFAWPRSDEAARKVTSSQLLMMLDGIDCFRSGTLVKLAE
jgi:transposase